MDGLVCTLAVVLLTTRNLHFLEERFQIQRPYKEKGKMLDHRFTQP
jgi:hypothetical protein